ncbi:M24 family metallopeptidase [Brachybacterium ginsengisoli]|nr:M24 family metallopeptidase [Brachybacterium ginsengisoli]
MTSPSSEPMPTCPDSVVQEHAAMQDMARAAMESARASLRPGQSLHELRRLGEDALRELGADSFWYWGIGAFVFAGEDTVLSVSGREYRTPEHILGESELITVDLSPQRRGIWGDFARTLVLEDGVPLADARESRRGEWSDAVAVEHALHDELLRIAQPDMTFEALAHAMNSRIAAHGFENLDFRGNLGHSIARESSARIYLELGNRARLDSVELFTVEPHIRPLGGRFGVKHENIYRFVDGTLSAL